MLCYDFVDTNFLSRNVYEIFHITYKISVIVLDFLGSPKVKYFIYFVSLYATL